MADEMRNFKCFASLTAPLLDDWSSASNNEDDAPSLHHYRKRASPWVQTYRDIYASAWEAAASMHESSTHSLQRQMTHLSHRVQADIQSLHERLDTVQANAVDEAKTAVELPTEDLLCLVSPHPPPQPTALPSWMDVHPAHVSLDAFERRLDEFGNQQRHHLEEQLAFHDAKWTGVLEQVERILQSIGSRDQGQPTTDTKRDTSDIADDSTPAIESEIDGEGNNQVDEAGHDDKMTKSDPSDAPVDTNELEPVGKDVESDPECCSDVEEDEWQLL